jgi:hypothetical protein
MQLIKNQLNIDNLKVMARCLIIYICVETPCHGVSSPTKNTKIGGSMKTLARIIGAALVMMFGIHGMQQSLLPAIALDAGAGAAKTLETISWNSSAPQVQPFVKTVMTLTKGQGRRTADAEGIRHCLIPVSLERLAQ